MTLTKETGNTRLTVRYENNAIEVVKVFGVNSANMRSEYSTYNMPPHERRISIEDYGIEKSINEVFKIHS
jgi:hypothetical protein